MKNKKCNLLKEVFCVNNKFDFGALFKNLAITLGGGALIWFLTKDSMATYDTVKKSILTPPNFIFPIVWTIIYTLIGFAAYRIYMNNQCGKNDYDGYFYYLIQLLINFLWPIVFFNLRLYGISFVLIIALLILIIMTTIKFFKVDKIAGIVMIPYILWISFASYLTFVVWMYNEM